MASTMRGVRNAESAVPPMPAPNTPVANPRRPAAYQALTNGIPIANEVPAIPRKNPHTSSIVYECSEMPTRKVGAMLTKHTTVNMSRPPYRSVSTPTGIRPSEPTSTGNATRTDVCVGVRSKDSE